MKSLLILFSCLLFPLNIALAQEGIQPYLETVEGAEQGMTLWQVLVSGGWVMIVLLLISLLMTALVVYLFMLIRFKRLIPEMFAHQMIQSLREGKDQAVLIQCRGREDFVSAILMAGLEKKTVENLDAARESVEMTARRKVSSLWTLLGYLSDIAAIAPMVGLLGTVIGMIEAFNTIAFQTAVVKPILLAGGVSKAMVTTAGGMIIAIAALIFYSFFRSRVQTVQHAVEMFANEISNAFDESARRQPGGRK